jgi:hypothetical protein
MIRSIKIKKINCTHMKKSTMLFLLFLLAYSNIKAQEITVFPGFWGEKYYQDEKEINKKELGTLMSTNPKSLALWEKSNAQKTTAWVFLGAQFGSLLWQFNRASNIKSQTLPLVTNLACGTTAVIFALMSNSSKKKAILSYNSGLDKRKNEQSYLVPASEGLGLGLRF